MEAKFTPGPWQWNEADDRWALYITGAQARLVVEISAVGEINEANANLIAAAPDLYAACDTALPVLTILESGSATPGQVESAIRKLRAALARARGEDR